MASRWYHVFGALFLGGCGLYQGGLQIGVSPEGGEGDDAGSGSDVASEPRPPEPCTKPPGACVMSLPEGWTPVVRMKPGDACPANFTELDRFTNPVAQPSACTCDCTIDTQPSCQKGTFDVYWGSTCGNLGTLPCADGACTQIGYQATSSHRIPLPQVTQGTCTGTPKKDASKVVGDPVRLCEAPPGCQEEICEAVMPTGGRSCVVHEDDVACPAGPWAERTVVGDLDLACSPCGTCTTSATCGAGTLRYYSDPNCKNQVAAVPINNMCVAVNAMGQTNYYRYNVPISNPSCTATGTTAIASLAMKKTICCKP